MNSVKLPQGRVYVAGHRGMVGGALVRLLQQLGIAESDLITRDRSELNLTRQADVEQFYRDERPDVVIFAAAKVGGIHANDTYPAEFIYDNLMMAANSIDAAYRNGTRRFLFLGSTCIYPRMAPQPMPEDCLLSGPLEPTNEAYALAKISGLKLCQHYRTQYGVAYHSAMPTNLYGPGDNYHPQNSHVMPAMIRRFDEAVRSGADEVVIWGTGTPRREFLHVDDLARGLIHLVNLEDPPNLVNVGTGSDISIRELAELIARVTGFTGRITQDPSKPDGTPVKRTNTDLIESTGWRPEIALEMGIKKTYEDYLQATDSGRLREV
ncbi:GDP-L-fucose synthase family protein [Roseiconus lacunae]|uniref:GDP-L-fucose synthase n=1 Tax=Roseiconus lacunae TaxID=2605694 RepID=A0ABT7PEW5_9BACT|nr:GDP-L-fucose synthase [Roseiconus lacunae]MDM4015035.1 GDP-L-fucose synthase [Roseiconus lacunae]WRQ50192.1 GDP-L-fucose synthase [Stieleria sp. HD01]